MTPTEETRKRLDKLGVEYDTFDTISAQNTYWNVGELRYRYCGRRYCGRKDGMTELTMFAKCGITPEQAISATVGGTCHFSVQDNLDETDGMGDVWLECDECHWQMPLEPSTPRFKFCPNCGRRVDE